MNKQDLVSNIAEKADVSKKSALEVLDATLEVIMEALRNGDKVTLVGFGTFSLSNRKERKGRKPQTGEELVIPASKAPKFTAGKIFKELLK